VPQRLSRVGELYEAYRSPEIEEEERLRLLCESYDALSRSRLERIALPRNASCLEIGAGLATISKYLAERVGPGGRVTATEVVAYAGRCQAANLSHVLSRLGDDPLPPGPFDLVMARGVLNVLEHGRDLLRVLSRAVKPGGHLFVETFDFAYATPNAGHVPSYIYERMLARGPLAHVQVCWADGLAEDMRALGLTITFAESTTIFAPINHPGRAYWEQSFRRATAFVCDDPGDANYEANLSMLATEPGVVALPQLTGVAARVGTNTHAKSPEPEPSRS